MREFFGIKDKTVLDADATNLHTKISGTHLTCLLFRALTKEDAERSWRRKVCQGLLAQQSEKGLEVRAVLLAQAKRAMVKA